MVFGTFNYIMWSLNIFMALKYLLVAQIEQKLQGHKNMVLQYPICVKYCCKTTVDFFETHIIGNACKKT